jgi:hypothetical protein
MPLLLLFVFHVTISRISQIIESVSRREFRVQHNVDKAPHTLTYTTDSRTEQTNNHNTEQADKRISKKTQKKTGRKTAQKQITNKKHAECDQKAAKQTP